MDCVIEVLFTGNKHCEHQWRMEGGVWGVQTPPHLKFRRPSKNSCQTQPDCEKC